MLFVKHPLKNSKPNKKTKRLFIKRIRSVMNIVFEQAIFIN